MENPGRKPAFKHQVKEEELMKKSENYLAEI